jgi:hypothetical protein
MGYRDYLIEQRRSRVIAVSNAHNESVLSRDSTPMIIEKR